MKTPAQKRSTTPKRQSTPPGSTVTQPGSSAPLPPGTGHTPSDAPLPHERDESAGVTDGIPSEPVRQAYRDLTRGLQDTDRGPVAGRVYRKLKS